MKPLLNELTDELQLMKITNKKILTLLLTACVATAWAQDLVPFKDETGKYGCKDAQGNIVVPPKYDYVWGFQEGLSIVMQNKKCGFIDNTGKEVIQLKYDAAFSFAGKSTIAPVMQNGKWGFVDKTAKEVTPLKYDRTSELVLGAGDLFGVIQNGKWGFIDQTGKEVTPFKYDSHLNFFKEGMLAVKQNKKWGFIDQTGSEVIPLIYDEVYPFKGGKARVKLGRSFFIDKTGNEIK